MGKYRITDPDTGQSVLVEGDSAPTEQEITLIFESASPAQPNMARTRSGYMNTEKGDITQRALALGKDPRSFYEPTPAEDMSGAERFGVGAVKALQDVPLGMEQLLRHAVPGMDTSGVDAQIRDREQVFQSGGLADTTGGQAGAVTGGIVGLSAPGGAGLKLAGKIAPHVPKVVAPFVEGGMAGAFEGAALPESGEDYWGDKSGSVVWGAGIGGGANTGMQALLRGGTGAANLPRRAYNAPNDMLVAANAGNNPLATQGTQLAQKHGVQLSPGQATGNKALQFAEQRARESFMSAGKVAQGDLVRADQYANAIRQIAGDARTPITGRELQTKTHNFVRDLFKQRSKNGRELYGAIDNMAKDVYETRKIVRADNTVKELEAIIAEAGTQEGGDIVKQAAYAEKMLETLAKQEGRYSAQEALQRLQSHSPYSKANVAGTEGFGYDNVLKGRVYDALMKDMAAAETLGGNLGEMVKHANKTWRGFTEQIDSVKNSVFGKMMGKEAGEGAITANTVSPAQVIKRLATMDYSEADDIMKFMGDNMPDMPAKVRGSILNDAIDAALMGPPSGGADFMFNPNQFMSALGLKSGKAGVEGMKRLEAIFGAGTKEWADMRELIEIGRRMGDAYGKNFSGTSQGNQFYALLRDFSSTGIRAAKRLASTGMEFAGLNRIADMMTPGTIDFGNLTRSTLLQPPRVTNRASRAAGVIAPAIANDY